MADERMLTKAELEASKGATGRIVRIVGPVVDVEFPADQLPAIYNALTVDAKTPAGEMHVVLEVETMLPGNLVRSVAMSSTDGLVRGTEVVDTGHPIMMPVGPETLGRIWNVIGEPVDEKPMPEVSGYMPIHRPAPEYDTLSTKTEIFETGIKAIDLIEPFIKGGKTVCSAALALARPLSSRSSSTTWRRSTAARPSSPASASVPVRVPTCTWR